MVATSTGGTAVLAVSTADPNTGHSAPALVVTAGPGGPAASFTGDVTVTGTLTATTKHFLIDHPLDPANRYLAHASVESWEHVNVYSGNVLLDDQGEAVVNPPGLGPGAMRGLPLPADVRRPPGAGVRRG